ncbi:hypothetical protein AbraIFM66951_003703 [Aspergillus brasiliensis]|uniref:Uncharacterized protein n=1 Tax=Aspergillus brasiliensis TaxID=319629 RepID=A0A9W5YNH9_9EURO|nr:hypothetical protein AbraCBS73388_004578 [Aspergillus brasiliensis]GKZ43149.1 hypothetical protein AbraIFM66951_003703 [Aspergillus brasiliensis]
MPSDDTSSQNRNSTPSDSRRWPDDETPLDAVRRFADEQVSSVLQSVMGIPSMSSRPSSDHWAIFDDEARFRRRDGGDAKGDKHAPGTAPGAADNSDHHHQRHNRYPAHSWSDWEDQWYADNHPRWRRRDRDNIFDFFFDRASFFDSPFSSRFFHPFHRSMFSDLASNSFGWPFSYLIFSPYSPLHLERQGQYHSHRDRGVFSSLMSSLSLSSENENENNPPTETHWREAFEDLIRLENGKPMLDQDTTALAKRETARDWLYGLAKRGSLGDQWKISESGRDGRSNPMLVFHGYSSNRGDDEVVREITADDNEPETMTELDMFDRFFEDAAARESKAFADIFESPILRLLLEERRRPHDTDRWLEPVYDDKRNKTAPETLPENQQQSTPVTESTTATEQPTVISTMTRTERVRLPDGSTQKKTVWTKRFSDGREESNETTEVLNPPHGQESSSPASTGRKDTGWFWRD